MLTLHRILCPVDYSEPSRRALRYALAIARWHGADIAVLHVQDARRHLAGVEAGSDPDLAERTCQELRQFIDDAGGSNRHAQVQIANGRAVPGILEHATRGASDLVVMGTNGRSGVARSVLGAVTEAVVRQATMPVLTIPPSAGVRASGELMPFDSILCASDFSAACRRALELAIVMGQEADARLILVHALRGTNLEVDRKDALARLKRGLPADAVFRCRPEVLVIEGRPADAILETAEREQVELIVMGSQTSTALDRLLFGSTSRRVMQAAMCPVLSIRGALEADPWPASTAVRRRSRHVA